MSDPELETGASGHVPANAISRRQAVAYTTLLATGALLTGCDFDALEPRLPAGDTATTYGEGFSFVHDESVWVVISRNFRDATKFDLTVRVGRTDTEFFEGLDQETVREIRSDHVSVQRMPIPS